MPRSKRRLRISNSGSAWKRIIRDLRRLTMPVDCGEVTATTKDFAHGTYKAAMGASDMTPELAEQLVGALREGGVDFVPFLPESRLRAIIPLIEGDETFTVVRVAHEGSAMSIASGAALVGRIPAVYMEQTGILLGLYHLLSVPMRAGLPLVILGSYVGSPADSGNNITWTGYGKAVEPVLKAVGIRYQVLEDGYRLRERVIDMVRAALAEKQPTCLLLTGEFTTKMVESPGSEPK